MSYPTASPDHVDFFGEHGWLAVTDAVEPADLATIEARCQEIIEKRDRMAFDWAWQAGEARDERQFRILQSSPTMFWPELKDSALLRWAAGFGSALLGREVEFWYDQFLAKPPDISVATRWHQDEAYWGRDLADLSLTCWMPMHDVDERNGCMHFIDRGHRDGVLEHRQPPDVQSDLIFCEPDESRTVACPIPLGSVTFHHGKTPHMTPANVTDSWRRILTQHLRIEGTPGEGDHYPWKVYVNQFTGVRTQPAVR